MTVRADVLLRALAITFVTYNHAHPYSGFELGWGGGMTFLMMLSGYNFARFGMRDSTPDAARRYLIRLGRGIFVPSIIAVAFFFVLLQKFSLSELLFYRNWLTPERISKFPTWYPQVVLQMFGGLFLVFSIPAVARTLLMWPLTASLVVFGLALGIRAWFPHVWDTSHLLHQLPHLFLWNFCLGWVVYFGMSRWPNLFGKVLVTGCAVLAASVWGAHTLDFYWLTIGVALLVLPLNLRMPRLLGQVFQLISQATLAIFLLHRFVYEVYEHLPIPPNEDAMWLIGLFGSLLAWMAFTAAVRAFRAVRRQTANSAISPPTDRARARELVPEQNA